MLYEDKWAGESNNEYENGKNMHVYRGRVMNGKPKVFRQKAAYWQTNKLKYSYKINI